jgi:HPt (histidine-containing phosphotransfer) domain-containing protein
MSPTLDLSYLREMMGNDEKVVHKFLAIFKDQCPKQLQELKLHYANQDWPALSNVAHSLKTQFKYLSVEALAEQVFEIETRAEEGRTDELGVLIQVFEKDLNELLRNTQLPS